MSSKPKKNPEAKCPLWMMTFGDCMSLLVTFFVMLIAFTNTETEQLLDMLGALKGALGMTPGVHSMFEKIPTITNFEKIRGTSEDRKLISAKAMSAIMPDSRMAFDRHGTSKVTSDDKQFITKMLERGMAFIIQTEDIFEPGTARLVAEKTDVWEQLVKFTGKIENEIRIIGVVPTSLEIKDESVKTAWGLGIKRALAVMEALKKHADYKESRFGVGGLQTGGGYIDAEGKGLPDERMEIIVIGTQEVKDISPKETVIQNRWK